jgi:hypothetical protein
MVWLGSWESGSGTGNFLPGHRISSVEKSMKVLYKDTGTKNRLGGSSRIFSDDDDVNGSFSRPQ